MKKQQKSLLSLTKKKIARLNHVYGIYGGTNQGAGDDNTTGGETTDPPAQPIPDTHIVVCVDGSKRFEFKKKKDKGPVVQDTNNI